MQELKKGAKFVVLTHQIKSEGLELFDMWIEDFSWGVATVYLYEKTQLVEQDRYGTEVSERAEKREAITRDLS